MLGDREPAASAQAGAADLASQSMNSKAPGSFGILQACCAEQGPPYSGSARIREMFCPESCQGMSSGLACVSSVKVADAHASAAVNPVFEVKLKTVFTAQVLI